MAKAGASRLVIVAMSLCLIIILLSQFAVRAVFPDMFAAEITLAADEYELDADLIRAVIWTESKYKEDAVSGKGASGLMQMLQATRIEQSEYSGVAIDGSAYSEIMLGTGYLMRMILATGEIELGLMAYNAGLRNVLTWEQPFKESSDYVKRVMIAYNIYRYLI